jgi:hypothetical protein
VARPTRAWPTPPGEYRHSIYVVRDYSLSVSTTCERAICRVPIFPASASATRAGSDRVLPFEPTEEMWGLCGAIVYSVRNGVGDPWLKVDPSASSVTLTGLECRYPTPLSTGGSRIRRDVTLLYAINGNEISVSSQDGQGNFGFELRAEVSDASGGPPPGVDAAPATVVHFDSDIVVMGPEYVNDVKDCFAIVKAINNKYAISKSVPRWMQGFTPAEREIQEGLDFLNALGDVQGE